MTNNLVKFGHGLVADAPITNDFLYGIYFASDVHKVGICTAVTNNVPTYEWYGGNVKNASMVNSVLTIELNEGNDITLDFSDVASASSTMQVFQTLQTAINGKVDKIDGKGLSTNDFTTAEKNKLTGIAAGAQVNTIETIKVNGVLSTPDASKNVNIDIPITNVKTGDKVLSLIGKDIGSTITMDYVSADKKIYLKGIAGTIISSVDATDFIKDGMVDNVTFDPVTKILTITFNTQSGKESIPVDLSGLVDTYTAGNGITITGNIISIKVDPTSESFLTVGANGLKISGVQTAINTATNSIKATIDAYTINGTKISTNPVLDGSDIDLSTGYAIATAYATPAVGDSLDVAIGKLAKGVSDASSAGVTSFNGQTGAIIIKGNSTVNGSVNFVMSGKELTGSVYGLGTAAYTPVGNYATAAQGTKADTAIQSATTAPDSYLSIIKNGTGLTLDSVLQPINTASASAKGLLEASDAKSYISTQIANINGSNLKITGYTKGTNTPLAATDTVNQALGKLEAKADAAVLYWYSF